MAIIFVNYEEFSKKKGLGYKSVELSLKNDKKIFNTGNFVKDWYNMIKFIVHYDHELESHWTYSSTVDDFMMDGAKYDSAYLHMVNDMFMLRYVDKSDENWYEDQKDIFEERMEFFVPENTQPTRKELKKMCEDEQN